MTGKFRLFIVIAIALTIVGIGYILFIGSNLPIKEEILSYTYRVEVTANRSSEYSLYVPTPIWVLNKTNAEFIADNMQVVTGNGQFGLVDTLYGPALNLTASDVISIEAKGQKKFQFGQKPRLILSMQIDTDSNTNLDLGDVQHQIKCLKIDVAQNLTVKITLNTSYNTGTSDFIYSSNPLPNGVMDCGWQIIVGYAYIEVD